MKKILIIKHGALGDIIFCEGAITDIKNHHKDDEVTLLTTPFFRKLLNNHPCIDRFEIDERKSRWNLVYLYRLIKKLRAQQYDMVYDLQNSNRTKLYHKLMMPVSWSGAALFASHRYRRKYIHQATCYTHLAKQLQLAQVTTSHCDKPNWLWLKAPVKHILSAYRISQPFVLLLPGSSKKHPQKRWPYYAQLARLLQQQGIPVFCAPGPDENELIESFPAPCLLDQNKPLSIPQLIGLSQHCACVIGNDSGPTHLLARCNTKGIALFNQQIDFHQTSIQAHYAVMQSHDLKQISATAVYDQLLSILSSNIKVTQP